MMDLFGSWCPDRACCAEEGQKKMEELLASMHDLTGSQALPVLAARLHVSHQHLPRPQHRSAAGATVSEQLSDLQALQQEGALAFSTSQVL